MKRETLIKKLIEAGEIYWKGAKSTPKFTYVQWSELQTGRLQEAWDIWGKNATKGKASAGRRKYYRGYQQVALKKDV